MQAIANPNPNDKNEYKEELDKINNLFFQCVNWDEDKRKQSWVYAEKFELEALLLERYLTCQSPIVNTNENVRSAEMNLLGNRVYAAVNGSDDKFKAWLEVVGTLPGSDQKALLLNKNNEGQSVLHQLMISKTKCKALLMMVNNLPSSAKLSVLQSKNRWGDNIIQAAVNGYSPNSRNGCKVDFLQSIWNSLPPNVGEVKNDEQAISYALDIRQGMGEGRMRAKLYRPGVTIGYRLFQDGISLLFYAMVKFKKGLEKIRQVSGLCINHLSVAWRAFATWFGSFVSVGLVKLKLDQLASLTLLPLYLMGWLTTGLSPGLSRMNQAWQNCKQRLGSAGMSFFDAKRASDVPLSSGELLSEKQPSANASKGTENSSLDALACQSEQKTGLSM